MEHQSAQRFAGKSFFKNKKFASKLFEAKGINYQIEIDQRANQTDVLMEFRQHIYLIMKEAINNLVKYSECTEAKIIVSYDTDDLSIIIKDNGKGFDVKKIKYGNGLNSMKQRAKNNPQIYRCSSNINEGTTIQLFIKI